LVARGSFSVHQAEVALRLPDRLGHMARFRRGLAGLEIIETTTEMAFALAELAAQKLAREIE